MSLYSKRGVSAQKEDVHEAVRNLNQGLFPFAFCKIYDDSLAGDSNYINVMHADGAGTKSILAYLYWKKRVIYRYGKVLLGCRCDELDDLLCVGIYDNIVFNSTIDRNKNLTGEVLQQIINGTQEVFDMLKSFGITINYLGGETAEVGDVVRTIAVNGTMTSRWEKRKIISNEKINDGDVIVGFASYGKANYETQYNSGIGSNGLTSARHDVLHKKYASVYKESFDNNLPEDIIYAGKHELTEKYADTTIGQMLLSPTRTYAPVLKLLLQNYFDIIHGLIHCSGGGQTKCLKYLHSPFRIIKDNLFAPPPIFKIIQQNSGSSLKEMYEVFNMGCRMELYCNRNNAATIIDIANSFGIDAQIIGRVEAADKKQLIITVNETELIY
jgi:phosphoribosylformylglycinamidine cyclo-ligase